MTKKNDKPHQTIMANTQTPPIMIDTFEFFLREDNLCFLRMATALPEGIVEQGKFFITKETLKNFISAGSKALDSFKDMKANGEE